jgi:hypothetical protein
LIYPGSCPHPEAGFAGINRRFSKRAKLYHRFVRQSGLLLVNSI